MVKLSTSGLDRSERTCMLLFSLARRRPSTLLIVMVCPITSIAPDNRLFVGIPDLNKAGGDVKSALVDCTASSFSRFPVLPCCTVILFVAEVTGKISRPIRILFCFSQYAFQVSSLNP